MAPGHDAGGNKGSSSNNGSSKGGDPAAGLLSAVLSGVRASNAIATHVPSKRALDSSRRAAYDVRATAFAETIFGAIANLSTTFSPSREGFASGTVEWNASWNPSDAETFEPVSDVVDALLEGADMLLDEARGISNAAKAVEGKILEKAKVVRNANVLRPQESFKDTVDNSRERPFRPRIIAKPHASSPLRIAKSPSPPPLPGSIEAHVRSLGVDVDEAEKLSAGYEHPYAEEIANAAESQNIHKWMLAEKETAAVPGPLSGTTCTWVDTDEKLADLIDDLCRPELRAFAVDLEHHSYRSFQGFLCLMQISTPNKDYLVDLIALRSSMHAINDVFTDPSKIKVFHGANSDVCWLQRDFGVYLVGLFDTGQAARVLGYPSAGLAYALKHFCGVHANKAYQLADWRVRPLGEELIKYAREDTHYLLYIFDRMRRELIISSTSVVHGVPNLLCSAIKRSAEVAQLTYEKPIYTPSSHLKLLQRRNLRFSKMQTRVFAALYEWRDRIARAEDESTEYVLPNRAMIKIATDTPTNSGALQRVCGKVPGLVRKNLDNLVRIIITARQNNEAAQSSASRSADSPKASIPKVFSAKAAKADGFPASPAVPSSRRILDYASKRSNGWGALLRSKSQEERLSKSAADLLSSSKGAPPAATTTSLFDTIIIGAQYSPKREHVRLASTICETIGKEQLDVVGAPILDDETDVDGEQLAKADAAPTNATTQEKSSKTNSAQDSLQLAESRVEAAAEIRKIMDAAGPVEAVESKQVGATNGDSGVSAEDSIPLTLASKYNVKAKRKRRKRKRNAKQPTINEKRAKQSPAKTATFDYSKSSMLVAKSE